MKENTDRELVETARQYHSSEAFNVLVIRHQGMVFSLAYTLLDDGAEAEDMAQEAFLRAYINLHTLNDPDKFAPWLRQITLRCCRKWLQGFRPELFRSTTSFEEEEPGAEDAGEDTHPIHQALIRERAQVVQSAVMDLPQHYRIPIILHYLEGMAYKEVAQFMDVPLGTVKSLISRARKRLKIQLESYLKEASAMMDHLSKAHTLPDDFHKCVEWLTEALRRSGILQNGTVTAIDELQDEPVPVYEWMYNSVRRLALQYTPDTPASTPTGMYLKIQDDHEGKSEVEFYQFVAHDMEHLPMIPRCFGAEYSEATGLSYCLTEDLSGTHEVVAEREALITRGAAVFTYKQLENLVTAVARFHAYWWEEKRLGHEAIAVAHPFRNQKKYDHEIDKDRKNWAVFVEIAGDEIPAEWHDLYEHALAKTPLLWPHYFEARFTERRNITLTNQQYITSFLYPKDENGQTALFNDIDGLSTNIGTDDLVLMLTSFFTPEQRQKDDLEQRLLRHYHDTLTACGVTGYSWDTLIMDYRVKIIWRIFLSVWDCVTAPPPKRQVDDGQIHGVHKSYWWPKMQCEIGAYQDWKCAELLDELI